MVTIRIHLEHTSGPPFRGAAVGAKIIAIDHSSVNRAVTTLMWEDACAGNGPVEEIWPEAAATRVIDAILTWARYRRADVPEVATLREEQLAEAGCAWSRAHCSPTIMLSRLGTLGLVLLPSDPNYDLGVEHAIRCITAAAAVEAVRELQHAALLDPLTGVGNRRALDSMLGQSLSRAARHQYPVSLVIADLDGLKQINDELGHSAGDSALQSLVNGLKAVLREEDDVFRVGGDEFVLLLPDTDMETIASVMHRAALVGTPTFSWGGAGYPADGVDAATLLISADQDLYTRRRQRPAH